MSGYLNVRDIDWGMLVISTPAPMAAHSQVLASIKETSPKKGRAL